MSAAFDNGEEADAVSMARARELFDILKADRSIPHSAGQWCGKRAETAQGRLLEQGVPPGAIGTAYLQAPEGQEMHVAPPPGVPLFSFSQTLAKVSPGQDHIVQDGFVFTQDTRGGRNGLVITRADGEELETPRKGWEATLGDNGATESRFGDHVAASIRVRTPEGVKTMVLDPWLCDGPASFAAWHERQGAPEGIAVNADWKGAMRPVPTTPQSVERLSGILHTQATPDAVNAAIDGVMDLRAKGDFLPYREMLQGAYGERFPGAARNPNMPVKYTDGEGNPLSGQPLTDAVTANARILEPYVAFCAFRDAHYDGAGVRPEPVAQAAVSRFLTPGAAPADSKPGPEAETPVVPKAKPAQGQSPKI
jgi:hypothetical protein